jgi:hypothetical protein
MANSDHCSDLRPFRPFIQEILKKLFAEWDSVAKPYMTLAHAEIFYQKEFLPRLNQRITRDQNFGHHNSQAKPLQDKVHSTCSAGKNCRIKAKWVGFTR